MVGTSFVKSFPGDKTTMNFTGKVVNVGAGSSGGTLCAVMYEDGDDEVMKLSEVKTWKLRGLQSTFSPAPKRLTPKKTRGAVSPPPLPTRSTKTASKTPTAPKVEAQSTPVVKITEKKAASVKTAAMRSKTTASEVASQVSSEALKEKSQGVSAGLSAVVVDAFSAECAVSDPAAPLGAHSLPTAAASSLITSDKSAAAARLRLTVLGGAVGEAFASVFVPMAANSCWGGSGGGAQFSMSSMWWGSSFLLNSTGALADGFLSVVESQGAAFSGKGSRHPWSSPRMAAAAACARGGVLAAYTSFSGMVMDAARIATSQAPPSSDPSLEGGLPEFGFGGRLATGLAFIALSLTTGAAAFTVGNLLAGVLLPITTPSQAAPNRTSSTRAKASAAAASGPPATVEGMAWFLVATALFLVHKGAGVEGVEETGGGGDSGDSSSSSGDDGGGGSDFVVLALCMLASSAAIFAGCAVLGDGVLATEKGNAFAVTALTLAVVFELQLPAVFEAPPAESLMGTSGSLIARLSGGMLTTKIVHAAFTGSFCGACSDFNGAARTTGQAICSVAATIFGGGGPVSSLETTGLSTSRELLAMNMGTAAVGTFGIASAMRLREAPELGEFVFWQSLPALQSSFGASPGFGFFAGAAGVVIATSCAVLATKKHPMQKEKAD
jgi:hypothetical protein